VSGQPIEAAPWSQFPHSRAIAASDTAFIADNFMPYGPLNKKSRLAVLLGVAALDLPPAVERRSLLIADHS
jgi:hypothetical protein